MLGAKGVDSQKLKKIRKEIKIHKQNEKIDVIEKYEDSEDENMFKGQKTKKKSVTAKDIVDKRQRKRDMKLERKE